MLRKTILAALLLTAAAPLLAQVEYTMQSERSMLPTDSLDVGGSIWNNTPDALWVNDFQFTPDPNEDWSTLNVYEINALFGEIAPGGYKSLTGFNGMFGLQTQDTATGMYHGSWSLYGGADSNATDLLGTWNLMVEVVSSYNLDVSVVGPTDRNLVGTEQTVYAHRYNNRSDRMFTISSWWIGSSSFSNFNYEFLYADLDSTVVALSERDQNVFKIGLKAGEPGGTYTGDTGIYGGYYPGDMHPFTAGNWSINVTPVPEPGAWLALSVGLGGLVLARRRR